GPPSVSTPLARRRASAPLGRTLTHSRRPSPAIQGEKRHFLTSRDEGLLDPRQCRTALGPARQDIVRPRRTSSPSRSSAVVLIETPPGTVQKISNSRPSGSFA